MFDPRGLDALFAPRSVAVVGASNDPNKIGGRPIAFLQRAGWAGQIVPVNPQSVQVQGLAAAATVAEATALGPLDQAIVAVAARDVPAAVQQCARAGVRAVQVWSSGFADAGDSAAQDALLATARAAGMRLAGPNSLGLFNADNGFFGTFATALDGAWPAFDAAGGNVGLATQSGAFGSYAYGLAQARGLRFSRFIATGNEADVDVAECIAHLAADPLTRVIVATFEGCRDGDRLVAALQAAQAADKPVLVMKTGRSEAGAAAAATHTGSLAGRDAVFDGVFRQYGAWRAHSLEQLIDAAYALCVGRPMRGPRLGVVTTTGGVGVLIADAVAEDPAGLTLPELSPAARERVQQRLRGAVAANPLDTSTGVLADLGLIATAMDELAEGTRADALLGFLAHVGRNPAHWAQLRAPLMDLLVRRPALSLSLCMLAPPEVRAELEAAGVPLFDDPSRAVAALSAQQALARLRASAQSSAQSADAVARVPAVAGALHTLDEVASKALLAEAGVATPPEVVAADAAAAVAAAQRMAAARFALKIVSPDITHKTEVGGVRLNVPLSEVAAAHDALRAEVARHRPDAQLAGVLVTPMLDAGVELIVATLRDPVFGPVLMAGLGGTWVEVWRDVGFRRAPLDRAQALDLLAHSRASALLDGVRGAAPVDRQALADLMVRLAALAAQRGDIDSIEINPLRLLPEGAFALDAVVIVRRPA